jgi:lysophospholipase L1-like esterase
MERFPNGARVCFVGDSMTAANQVLSRVIDHYNKHFPGHGITFWNCGASGSTCGSAITFFEDDVLPHKPTHAVVAFGINDCQTWHLRKDRGAEKYQLMDLAFARYQKNMFDYTRKLVANGVQVILCAPPIYDEYTPGETPALQGCYATMVAYAAFIRQFAAEYGFGLCDYNSFMARQVCIDTRPVFTADRVHPTEHGYYLMAKCFLAAQGMQIDEEAPIPAYMDNWREAVRRLRCIYGAEHMVVRTENYHLPTEEKLALVQKKLAENAIANPAIVEYARGYLVSKPEQETLYPLVDRLYEEQIHPENK